MSSDPSTHKNENTMSLSIPSPTTRRWKRASSFQFPTDIDNSRTPGLESNSTTLDVQSDFGRMDIDIDDPYDSINRSNHFHHRAASVDTGLPDRHSITKRKLDDYSNSTKDDLALCSRSSRQSSAETTSNDINGNNHNSSGGVKSVYPAAVIVPSLMRVCNRPISVSSESSPVPSTASLKRKTPKTHSDGSLSQRSIDIPFPSSPADSEFSDDFNPVEGEIPLFRSDEVWVTSRRAQLQWLNVQGESYKRLLLRIDPCITLDADFGILLDKIPMLTPRYDANGSKIYMRELSKNVALFAVRQSSDLHPLFHTPQNTQPQRTSYARLAKLPDSFSWVEEVLAIGRVQLKIALFLEEQLAKTLFLRPVCDHPVYSQYYYQPGTTEPLCDDRGQVIFADVRARQLLGVFDKRTQGLLFLLDCLADHSHPSLSGQHSQYNSTPVINDTLCVSSVHPNLLQVLLRGAAIRPQLQGEVYKARVVRLNAKSNSWINSEEFVCLKVSCLAFRGAQRGMSNDDATLLASDLRRFRPLVQHPLHSEDIVQDIQTMRFFASQQIPIPGFLQSLYVAFDPCHLYSATRFVTRGTLFDELRQRRPLPFSFQEIQRIMHFVLRQVHCMHRAELIHGDLYLDNILIRDPSGKPSDTNRTPNSNSLAQCDFLLMDFGQSRSSSSSGANLSVSSPSSSSSSTSTTEQVGLFSNIPKPQGKFVCFTPESFVVHGLNSRQKELLGPILTCMESLRKIEKREAMEKADVWQLGVMMFMLLVGKDPFSMVATGPQQTAGAGYQDARREKICTWFKNVYACNRVSHASGHGVVHGDNRGNPHSTVVEGATTPTNTIPASVTVSTIPTMNQRTASETEWENLRNQVLVLRHLQLQSRRSSQPQPNVLATTSNIMPPSSPEMSPPDELEPEMSLPEETWSFLESMLQCDPLKRASVSTLLRHPFLTHSFRKSRLSDPFSVSGNDGEEDEGKMTSNSEIHSGSNSYRYSTMNSLGATSSNHSSCGSFVVSMGQFHQGTCRTPSRNNLLSAVPSSHSASSCVAVNSVAAMTSSNIAEATVFNGSMVEDDV